MADDQYRVDDAAPGVCVSCHRNLSDFNFLLCQACADHYCVIDEAKSRLFYSFLFNIARMVENAGLNDAGRPVKQDGAGNSILYISPTITFRQSLAFLKQKRIYDLIRNLDGDVVECGVGAGRSLLWWLVLSWDEGKNRNVWGFDSFVGFPEPTKEDKPPDTWRSGNMSVSKFLNTMALYGLPIEWSASVMTILAGWFKDTLHQYPGDRIVLLHLDCDLYESYKTSLEIFAPKVVPGGIILVDEYLTTIEALRFPGAVQAVSEFFSDHRGFVQHRDSGSGKYYFERIA